MTRSPHKGGTQKLTRLSLLVALGLALYTVESLIPLPLGRVGLANLATLLALFLFGGGETLLVMGIRVLLGSILLGGPLNPASLLSFAGGGASTSVMILLFPLYPRVFSIVGISIWGALAHNIAQLLAVWLLLGRAEGIFSLLPLIPLISLAGGLIVGLLAWLVISRLPAWEWNNHGLE